MQGIIIIYLYSWRAVSKEMGRTCRGTLVWGNAGVSAKGVLELG
jgi:hypothetical protein